MKKKKAMPRHDPAPHAFHFNTNEEIILMIRSYGLEIHHADAAHWQSAMNKYITLADRITFLARQMTGSKP